MTRTPHLLAAPSQTRLAHERQRHFAEGCVCVCVCVARGIVRVSTGAVSWRRTGSNPLSAVGQPDTCGTGIRLHTRIQIDKHARTHTHS